MTIETTTVAETSAPAFRASVDMPVLIRALRDAIAGFRKILVDPTQAIRMDPNAAKARLIGWQTTVQGAIESMNTYGDMHREETGHPAIFMGGVTDPTFKGTPEAWIAALIGDRKAVVSAAKALGK